MQNALSCMPPVVNYDFRCHPKNQKMLIDAIIRYSDIELPQLAEILSLSTAIARDVMQGKYQLKQNDAVNLANIFLVCFGG